MYGIVHRLEPLTFIRIGIVFGEVLTSSEEPEKDDRCILASIHPSRKRRQCVDRHPPNVSPFIANRISLPRSVRSACLPAYSELDRAREDPLGTSKSLTEEVKNSFGDNKKMNAP